MKNSVIFSQHDPRTTIFLTIIILSLWQVTGRCQTDLPEVNQPYHFESTVRILRVVDEGFIIYQRPDDYRTTQGFIAFYEAFLPYLHELRDLGVSTDPLIQPDLGKTFEEFVFINPHQVQRFYLNNYWFGFGLNWVPVDPNDYHWLVNKHIKRVNRNPDTVVRSKKPGSYARRYQKRLRNQEILDFDEHFELSDEPTIVDPRPNNETNGDLPWEAQPQPEKIAADDKPPVDEEKSPSSHREHHDAHVKNPNSHMKGNNLTLEQQANLQATKNVIIDNEPKDSRYAESVSTTNSTQETTTLIRSHTIFFIFTLLVLGLLVLSRRKARD